MDGFPILWLAMIVSFIVAKMVIATREDAAAQKVLVEFGAAAGWSQARRDRLFASGLRGRWREYGVALVWERRRRLRHALLTTAVAVRGRPQLVITRRGHQVFEKPVSFLGPPLIEPAHPAAKEFWVRSDEPLLADVLFADEEAVRLLRQNIVESPDRFELSARELNVRRLAPHPAIRRVAEQEWALVTRAVEVFALSPLV